MTEKIIILDFGSQYTQLIARVVREANVYCEILPYNASIQYEGVKGVILSGSPFSVNQPDAPIIDLASISNKVPLLGICYGAQLTAKLMGGLVEKSDKREYGRALLNLNQEDILFNDMPATSQIWMSHSDSIKALPAGFKLLGITDDIPVAAFKREASEGLPLYGLQFHPEVYHSVEGKKIIANFLTLICGCSCEWTPGHFIRDTVASLKEKIGDGKVVMGLSGGVNSTVAATSFKKQLATISMEYLLTTDCFEKMNFLK